MQNGIRDNDGRRMDSSLGTDEVRWEGQTMLIHSKIESSVANGPGNRAVIWLQGCSLACPGCWNPETHLFDIKKETELKDIVDWVKNLKDVEGITFSGGEPFQQAQYLYLLMYAIRKERPDLTIGMFSGYSIKELEAGRFKWKSSNTADWIQGTPGLWAEIKSMLDWGVFGRYNQMVKTTKDPLRGSLNQELVFFTNKYSEKDVQPQIVEVQIDEDALVQITGFPNEEFRKEYPVEGEKLVTTPKSDKSDEGEDFVCA